MTRDPLTQRLAGHLIRRACRRLPDDIRDERYREWAAELPAILHDPGIRFALRRSARALRYAVGTIWSTRRQPRATGYTGQRQHAPRTPPSSPSGLMISPPAWSWAWASTSSWLCSPSHSSR
jgi:hypothetical protein